MTKLTHSLTAAGLIWLSTAWVFPANAGDLVFSYVVFPDGTEIPCLGPTSIGPLPPGTELPFATSAPTSPCPNYVFSFWNYAGSITTNPTLSGTATFPVDGSNVTATAWYLDGAGGPVVERVSTYAFSANDNKAISPTPIESVSPVESPPLWAAGSNAVSTNASSPITINALPSVPSYGNFASWFLATPNQAPPNQPLQPPSYSPALSVPPHSDYPVAIAFYLRCPLPSLTCPSGTSPHCTGVKNGSCECGCVSSVCSHCRTPALCCICAGGDWNGKQCS